VFAIVMATGIVSVAADDHDYPRIALLLGALAVLLFAVLLSGVLAWVAARPFRLPTPTRDPDVALRMFTFVAACAVLRLRLHHHPTVGWALAAAALIAWLALLPLAIIDVASRPGDDLREHARGAWLLPSVATAGLVGVGADLGVQTRARWPEALATVCWVAGIAMYVGVVSLILRRALAAPLTPEQVTPDSWILMGALAISTLAGDQLLVAARALGEPNSVTDPYRVLTLTMWILTGCWIPVLLYAEMWRADHLAGSLRYHRAWWTAVFPLGMYSAATAASALAMHALNTVSLVFFWDALAVWLLVAVGLVHHALIHRIHGVPHMGQARARVPR
jgi:tellurite resistance protein TehA-like permease